MGDSAPIGVFDSGVGGLTVLAALQARLPGEAVAYLGDTARVPYGTKSPDVIRRYALRCSEFLVEQGAKLIVIACNTASAVAVDAVREVVGRPVLGVIEPGAAEAARATKNRRVGVIGTESTIASGSYQKALEALDPRIEVIAAPCPLFVPLAEEGLVEHQATRLLAQDYLAPLRAQGIDTLVLGCTHYPLLKPVIRSVIGPEIIIIDSAAAVAETVAAALAHFGLASGLQAARPPQFFATDVSQRLHRVARAFLATGVDEVQLVDL